MYTDIDSILFDSSYGDYQKCNNNEETWIRRIDQVRLRREDLVAIYGIWAEDAAKAGFLKYENGIHSCKCEYDA